MTRRRRNAPKSCEACGAPGAHVSGIVKRDGAWVNTYHCDQCDPRDRMTVTPSPEPPEIPQPGAKIGPQLDMLLEAPPAPGTNPNCIGCHGRGYIAFTMEDAYGTISREHSPCIFCNQEKSQ